MRRIRLLLLSVGVAGAIAAACSTFEGDPATEADGGAAEAGSDGPVDSLDSGPADAGADAFVDAGADAGDMVLVPAGPSFLIDRTEVTFTAYTEFSNAAAGDAGFQSIDGCHFKTSIGPPPTCTPASGPNDPMTCVDWCDAIAYCTFRGKRLCGKIGGGANGLSKENDVLQSQWTRGCTGSIVAMKFPYGTSPDVTKCNTIGNPDSGNVVAPVASFPGCVGGVPGLYDMSGNVEEWADSCSGVDNGATDTCAVHGGSWQKAPTACDVLEASGRGDPRSYRGFRCCKDVP